MSEDDAVRQQSEVDLTAVENYFINLLNPNIFTYDSTKNAVVEFENNFNSLCAALETVGHSTKDITVMELYSKLKHFKDVNPKK